jgi:spore coat polysaccharide biosynthesis predicted glycosyltransferase SpsG
MKKNKSFVFRVDADEKIGIGHLFRCIALAQKAKKNGADVLFLLAKADSKIMGILASRDFQAQKLSDIFDMPQSPSKTSTVVVDILNDNSNARRSELLNYLADLRLQYGALALFDDAGTNALRNNLKKGSADFIFSPYVGEIGGKNVFTGTAYFILNNEFENLPPKKIRNKADRILITCGGADPKEISTLALRGLAMLTDSVLNIRVIIGPDFSLNNSKKIEAMASNTSHNIQILRSPPSLYSSMLWSDLSIGTTGLTKYELAATGTPALLISLDETHEIINQSFVEQGSARDIGKHSDCTQQAVAENTQEMLLDVALRKSMATAGQHLVDGRGCDRVFALLEKVCESIK